MDKNICPQCGIVNESTRYFCSSCGSFLNVDSFAEETYELSQLKLMRIIDNLCNMRPGEQVPDAMFAYHAEKMEKFAALAALPEFAKSIQIQNAMKEFLSLCRHPDFQIAFVGTIKTGKSTLINALLGKNYASMAVTPETAALTKFRFSSRDYVEVIFYTKQEWEKLWASRYNADKFMEEYNLLNADLCREEWIDHLPIRIELTSEDVEAELSKWSSSKSPEHYFVKEIEVGISTLPQDFPPQVVFVDTPGLFDPVAYRSQLTQQYIRRANAVFVCVDAQKVQQPEIETIASVFSFSSNNKEKVHIIATHWDKLNNPESDWQEQKAWLVRQLTGKGFFLTKEIAQENIMHAAAYIHILCRDYENLDKQEMKALKKFAIEYDYDESLPEDCQKMLAKANIKTVSKVIKEKLARNYRKYLQEDIENKFVGIKHDLQRIAEDLKEDTEELLEASKANFDEFKAMAEKKRRDYEEIQTVSKQLNAVLDQVETRTARQMESICGQLRLKVNPSYNQSQNKKKRPSLREIVSILGRNKGK